MIRPCPFHLDSVAFSAKLPWTSRVQPNWNSADFAWSFAYLFCVMRLTQPLAAFRLSANDANSSGFFVSLWAVWLAAFVAKLRLNLSVVLFRNLSPALSAWNSWMRFLLCKSGIISEVRVMPFAKTNTAMGLSADSTLRLFGWVFSMQRAVLFRTRKQLKIFNPIVYLASVSMVNNLAHYKRPFDMLGHIKPMLQNLTVFPSVWVVGCRNEYVSIVC